MPFIHHPAPGRRVRTLLLGAALLTAVSAFAPASAWAADKTSKYRVYQNDHLLMEFYDYAAARQYAAGFTHSHVEAIGSGDWLWSNFPRYRVYQNDITLPEWEFGSLHDAIAEASHWSHASVRDLQGSGWVWNNYPHYRLYQGTITLPGWEFQTLEEAKAEAGHWANAHIIDLRTNGWVWDNMSDARKQELRSGPAIYQVQQGSYAPPNWRFAELEDAVNEALHWAGSTVVDLSQSGKVVYSNVPQYEVYQNDKWLNGYVGLEDAIAYAESWAHASIRVNGHTIWTNTPTYAVYQNDNRIGEFSTIPAALAYARGYANASIQDAPGESIWNNARKLLYWGWNGVSGLDSIKAQVLPTQGLDVDSPSWFTLADESGTLKDSSTAAAANTLRGLGLSVEPLVSNQFDSGLTSKFLANPAAQDKFVQNLVGRCAELGLAGFNIDFEMVAGSDRAAYTAFMRKLTAEAHAKGLKVSIDLPRGDVKWDAKTAYDQEALAGIVDYIMIMAYDQYYSSSTSAGSVAGLPWVEDGIRQFLAYGIPRDKLLLGIPFYVREWTYDAKGTLIGNKAIYTSDLDTLLAGKQTTMTWDATFGQYRIEFPDGGGKTVLWLENADSLKARVELAKKYELGGVAMWRLGQEPASFWTTLIQSK